MTQAELTTQEESHNVYKGMVKGGVAGLAIGLTIDVVGNLTGVLPMDSANFIQEGLGALMMTGVGTVLGGISADITKNHRLDRHGPRSD